MSAQWPSGARRWSLAEIDSDVDTSKAEFRERRLGEPLQRYLDAYDAAHPVLAPLIDGLESAMANGSAPRDFLRGLWSTDEGKTAFRYLAAPPISEDDLQTLASATLGPRALDGDAAGAQRLIDVMRVIVDPRRFPWLEQTRPARQEELRAAKLASSVLVASQRVQTLRRGDEKAAIEGAVKGLLVGMGWQAASPRSRQGVQRLASDSPAPRTFLTQTNLGSDNADVIVRLDDARLLAIECKGSNSEINSRKRLNKEAAQNARAWLANFGAGQVVPAVALQGVFKASYVAEAQDTPMAIFWGHRLDDLKTFIEQTRPSPSAA